MAYSQIRLKILPSARCLFDRLVQVKVEGLAPFKPVELRSKLVDDRGVIFKASALYQADDAGQVDVCHAPSLGGSYTGVEPMGLFWSMAPDTAHSKLLKRNVLSPTLVEMAAVSRETGKGPFPGIVDLYTLGGGLSEPRACLLANKGFVVLALAYYGYQDLPKNPKNLDLEYFEEAVTYLRSQPEVKGPGVGIISISHSGALALSMSSLLEGITATVCINGCSANCVIPLHYKDIVIPPLHPTVENVKISDSGLINIRDVLSGATLEKNRASLIPIERASCRFLFAVAEDDQNWNSALFAQQAAATLRLHGKASFQVVAYPKAGHFLEVPHMPHCPSGFHAAVGGVVLFGGEPKAHSVAQLDLWERVQEFFKSHLDNESTC
ncbi:hypothetical protein F2P81_024340 [Scophthalmus maximus]|uniref:Acyl-coenzyme A thioesterase 1-like n=1 Tax=Scophthalmus maximus TaxID=52904 RepID=A0A6A4RWG3_SCOMX|nr:hypothetical protein F2P81_024340 [Scophthalmus maximus]